MSEFLRNDTKIANVLQKLEGGVFQANPIVNSDVKELELMLKLSHTTQPKLTIQILILFLD